jgi:hypothetical protein
MGEGYDKANAAFKKTFALLFGECNLELRDLEGYLMQEQDPMLHAKSGKSGRPVLLGADKYARDAAFVRQDEIDYSRRPEPLCINSIKDLDSLLSAISERVEYAGSKQFGECTAIEESDMCTDSHFVYRSHHVSKAKYAAYSTYVRDGSEYVFGSAYFPNCSWMIRGIGAVALTRAFECALCMSGSDLFFCHNCIGCSNLMFSFNQKNMHNMIGNIELPRHRYNSLRAKLVAESREYIEKHREFPSLFSVPKFSGGKKMDLPYSEGAGDLGKIERAWNDTCRIVLGRELGTLDENGKFLSGRIPQVKKVKTAFGNHSYSTDLYYYEYVPEGRAVNSREAMEAGKLRIRLGVNEAPGLAEMLEKVRDIAFYRMDFYEGSNANNIETLMAYSGTNTYRVGDATYGKNCAYCRRALNFENQFGCDWPIHSKFCIKCYNSDTLSSCMEMDSCTSCTDCHYCHNCEGLTSCMFCFNAKSLRYAIGNVEVGREKYLKIREMALAEITRRVEKSGTPGFDIFSIGSALNKKI